MGNQSSSFPGPTVTPGAPPSGPAGGDLTGTYPNPLVASVGGLAAATIAGHPTSMANPHSVTAAQTGAVPLTQKGAAGGVATLDGSTKIPVAQIPTGTSIGDVVQVVDVGGAIPGLPALDGSLLIMPATPPTGTAGGDLSGSYPNPSVATVGGVAASAIADHVNNVPADPHGQYQLESEKGVANGYASLDAAVRLPDSQIPLSGLEQFSTGRITFDGFTRLGGLDLRVGAGRGYKKTGPPTDAPPAAVSAVVWAVTDLTLPANTVRRIGVDGTGTVVASAPPLDPETHIILGTIRTGAATVEFISLVDVDLIQPISDLHDYLAKVVGGVVISGMLVSVHIPPSLQVAVDSGEYYIAKDNKTAGAAAPAAFTAWYRDGVGGWTAVPGEADIDPNFYDDGSGTLAAVPAGEYIKHLLYATPSTNTAAEYHLVYGQETFPGQAEAEVGNLPVPPDEFSSQALRLAGVVSQEGSTQIASIVQVHPRLGSFAPPVTTVVDHGGLLGLSDNDHPQYQLVSEKGAAGGYAPLDGGGLVLTSDLPQATETAIGAAELATQAETDGGTDDQRIVTPLKLGARALTGGDLGGSIAAPIVNRVSQNLALTGVISPTSIGANQNDYNPTGLATASRLRLTSSGAFDLTGLAGGATGRILALHNIGANRLNLLHESASSTAANRFATAGAITRYLLPGAAVWLVYDGTISRWRVFGTPPRVVERFDRVSGSAMFLDNYAVKSVGSNSQGYFTVPVPNDFGTLVSMGLVGIVSAGAAGAGRDIDRLVSFGAIGESSTTHAASDLVTTYDLTGLSGIIYELSYTDLLGALLADDFLGIQVDHNSIGGAIDYLGARLRYIPRH